MSHEADKAELKEQIIHSGIFRFFVKKKTQNAEGSLSTRDSDYKECQNLSRSFEAIYELKDITPFTGKNRQ